MKVNIVIAGAGALGSQIIHHLARPTLHFIVADRDKVEQQNIRVSVYDNSQIGRHKAEVAAEIATKRGASAEARVIHVADAKDLSGENIDLLIDCFDNVPARAVTTQSGVPTVHVGVGTEGNGMIMWDDHYSLPPTPEATGNPICTNALGATILRRTALRAAEIIDHWIATDDKVSDLVSERS